MDRPKTQEPSSRARQSRGSNIRFLLVLVILAWAFRSLVVAPFSIPSGSMLPTLYIGDYLMVAKWPYGYSRFSFPFQMPSFPGRLLSSMPQRGDVVVFRHPSADTDLIKRVIGLPGDAVEVKQGSLILNGRAVTRTPRPGVRLPISHNSPCKMVPPAVATVAKGGSQCVYRAWREALPGGVTYTVLDQVDDGPADNFPLTRVPPGHVFLMGDNRDDSLDSRFPAALGGVGMLPIDRLIGRALVTFWSTDGSASYVKPWTWFTALRGDRIGNGYNGGSE